MAHFKHPFPLSYTMYSQSATPQYPFDFALQEKSQSFSLSDDDLQHLYLNNTDHRSTRLPQGPLLDRSRSIPHSMIPSEPSPSFAPSSMGSVPMTTSYSMSPPSTGMPEEHLPLTPYTQLPSLFPTAADATTLSPTHFASHQIATQHDTMFASQLPDTFASQSHQQYYFSSPDMSSNLPSAFNPMSAPADLSSGHALLHSDPSLLGAFGLGNHALGLKMEDDDEMGVRSQHSQSLSPHMFGISGPLRTPSGVLGEDESQFSMEMDEDGLTGGSPATLYPRPSPLTHSTSASQLDTRTIRVSRVPGSSQMGVYNADGQLIPCPSSAPPLSSMFPTNDTSSMYGDRSLQDSPSPTLGSVSAVDRRRPRRASHHHVDDGEYIDSSSRRPRMRTAISVPSSLPNRPSRTGLSSTSSSGLPAVGPNEMVITASIPVRRGRANTLFGGRAPRSVVPTPVPNLTKKSRGRRVPVARPLDFEDIATNSLGSDGNASVLLPTRRSSRVSATPTSATDKENDGDEGLSAEEDDDDEFTSPSGSKPKSGKSKMSPRMQALVDEAIARGCSTTASGKARIFTCPVGSCLKCFARGEHLKRHVRSIHTEEKPYECDHPGCGKKFSRHDNLKQHKRVHKDKIGASGAAGPKVDMGLLQFDLEAMDDE